MACASVKKADGKQPTAAVVQEMVFEILHPEGPAESSPSRSQRRSEVVSRLREVVAQRKPWAQVEQLMEELEELL